VNVGSDGRKSELVGADGRTSKDDAFFGRVEFARPFEVTW
jgi:hypothetical protein